MKEILVLNSYNESINLYKDNLWPQCTCKYDLKIKERPIIHIDASLQSFFGKHRHEMISCIIFHINEIWIKDPGYKAMW